MNEQKNHHHRHCLQLGSEVFVADVVVVVRLEHTVVVVAILVVLVICLTSLIKGMWLPEEMTNSVANKFDSIGAPRPIESTQKYHQKKRLFHHSKKYI